MARVAELQFSQVADRGQIELIVPSGTPNKDVLKLRDVLTDDLLARLPRGCQACLSGDHFIIRERLDVIQIDLDKMEVVGP
jgi:hypothetical protein